MRWWIKTTVNVQRGGWLLGWLGLRLVQMVEYNTRAVDLERDSATAQIAQRRKSAGTIRQAAWPVARGRAKPPPRTPPPHPCRGRPRHIHPGTFPSFRQTPPAPCTGKSTRCPFPPGRHPPPDSHPPVHRDLLLPDQSHRRRNFQSHPVRRRQHRHPRLLPQHHLHPHRSPLVLLSPCSQPRPAYLILLSLCFPLHPLWRLELLQEHRLSALSRSPPAHRCP